MKKSKRAKKVILGELNSIETNFLKNQEHLAIDLEHLLN